MKFFKENVYLVDIREFKSKNGNNVCILTLADPDDYFKSMEFIPSSDMDYKTLVRGKHYDCELDFGRYSSVTLTPVKK